MALHTTRSNAQILMWAAFDVLFCVYGLCCESNGM
jgi:hypothetical protein